ncbi:HD-GYP domain-containing protein [Pseudomonas songnenensis]|uniref:HD-GYP domain-containing protein n=1 Tax=Pseudomonas songnenensis TaxID=1176259 RepID=A0ABX9UPM5_9PSED|nr:HD-GYP domain-containing protein [Pseudomonas songnenensis]AWM58414.1 HD-GYP domain-containing protein [Stutzerimonas stutzeri]MCQ4301436.1 HD-GYP domain-containing protein [Pseudomonas songnenensis]RMH95027.1 HD-GYP domain-containing protein [Pseudomonas songnenensis]
MRRTSQSDNHTDTLLVPTRRRVAVASLELGMYVCELDRPWNETNFAFQGFPLLTPGEIRAVRSCCDYVYVDDTRRVRLQHGAPVATGTPRVRKPQERTYHALSTEVEEARAAYQDGSQLIEQVLADVQHGRVIDTRACHGAVKRNLESMLRNESAMLWLIRLKNKDLYTSLHCLSVSIMAMGFGNHLGLQDDKLQLLGMAGLLHDVGKMRIDPQILNKPGKLTPQEFEVIKRHPVFGLEALRAQPGVPEAALHAAYGHHERLDGTGYPLGSGPGQISYMTRIITIVDAFDAITSHRAYDCARPVQAAFEILRSGSGRQFDEDLVLEFIRWLGAFPVGTLVELHTGEVAVVVEKHKQFQLRPRVVVLRDAAKQRCAPRYLDLAQVTVDAEGTPYRISIGLPDGSFGLHIADPELQSILHPRTLADFEQAT